MKWSQIILQQPLTSLGEWQSVYVFLLHFFCTLNNYWDLSCHMNRNSSHIFNFSCESEPPNIEGILPPKFTIISYFKLVAWKIDSPSPHQECALLKNISRNYHWVQCQYQQALHGKEIVVTHSDKAETYLTQACFEPKSLKWETVFW